MKVAMLSSQDVVSRRDLLAAYRYLNIQPGDANTLSDERIIELFQAQQPDLGAVAAEEARQALNKIGTARHSQLLVNTSRQSVDTYEDALTWLGNGANKDTSDDTILAILAAKVCTVPTISPAILFTIRCFLVTDADCGRLVTTI